MIPQDKLYDIIYADPPWRYSFSKSKSRQIENQYPTMSLQEIKDRYQPEAPALILVGAAVGSHEQFEELALNTRYENFG